MAGQSRLKKICNAMDFLLSQILSKNIPIESVTKWISNPKDVPEEIRSLECCTNTDFSLFLLNYLREQTSSLLSSKSSATPDRDSKSANNVVMKKENNRKSTERRPRNVTPTSNKSPVPLNVRHSSSPSENIDLRNKNCRPSQSKTSPSNLTLGNFIITPKTSQKHRKNKLHPTTELNIDSSNEFPDIETPSRRINPTRVTLKSGELSETKNPFANVEEISASDFVNERQLLKVQKEQVKSDVNKIPSSSKVTNKDRLDILSNIYNCIINNNLALNIMNELYFLIELLTIESSVVSENDILGNVHNCVYFASVTLNSQRELFELLDCTTIRFLSENTRLREFSEELVEYLKHINVPIKRGISISNNSNGVTYQTDTDEKQNFSSIQIFQIFRKHRDMFYSVLEKWDIDRHFTNILVKNIEAIFKPSQNLEPEFYVHFSKLFVLQMIASCIGEGAASADKPSQLPDLQVDPQRLRRLHERLVTPAKTAGGPCPAPEFSGWEEFFRDFMMISGNPQFHQHLQNALVTKLVELNSQQFVASELQDSETSVEEETKSKFLSCALSSQLLAKFLGFLHFLPYRASVSATKKLSEHTISLQASLRHDVNPILNTHTILCSAQSNARLILTVPWMCSYLTQLDPVSLKLDMYQRTLTLMVTILRGLGHGDTLSGHSKLLLRLTLGWGLGVLVEISASVWEIARIEQSGPLSEADSIGLDGLELVDSRALFSLCPYLTELRGRLAGGGGRGTCAGPRHITPIAASTLDPAHQLELQLESNFLQTQPSSVRRSLEFVSERVASLCTKQITSKVVSHLNLQINQEIHDKVVSQVSAVQESMAFTDLVNLIKDDLSTWATSLAETHIRRLHDACMDEARQFCASKCSSSLSHLLPQSCTQAQVNACLDISARNACTKVHAWVTVHLTIGEVQKQVTDEVERCTRSVLKPEASKHDPKYSNTLPPGGRDVRHDKEVSSPADVLIQLRETMLFLQNGGAIDEMYLTSLLESSELVIASRGDLIPSAQTSIQCLTVDLAVCLACHQADLLHRSTVARLVLLWRGAMGRPQSLDRLLCARNLHQISVSKSPGKTWAGVQMLLAALVRGKLVTPASIEEQAVAVLQQEWSEDFLHRYTSCMQDLVREVGGQISAGESASFSHLLQWLADFCYDLDDMS